MLEILDEAKLQKFQEILEKIYKETNVEDIETLVEYFANSLREVIPWLNLESKFRGFHSNLIKEGQSTRAGCWWTRIYN